MATGVGSVLALLCDYWYACLLEEHDISTKAEAAYKSLSARIKEQYAENPMLTAAVGLGILIVILLLF